jgi:plasmid stability protein
MATLNVKNFPDDLYRALRRQARERGRSLSREVTVLLREQVQVPKKYTVEDLPKALRGAFRRVDIDAFLRKERESW